MDTDVLTVSMKEKFFLSTTQFKDKQTKPPGQILKIVADPIGSMIDHTVATGTHTYAASALAITASRFRDFMYVGSSFALVPAASTAQVDPAHISDNGAGSSNYLDPIDLSACIHYRRWLGGDFMVPSVDPTGIPTGGKDDPKTAYFSRDDSLKLDVAWLNDARFNHVPVTDGFSFDSVPMEASVVTAAHATDSVFGYFDPCAVAAPVKVLDGAQPRGVMSVRGAQIQRRLWGPNPFAGFRYKFTSEYETEDPNVEVSGINRSFPWFADMTKLSDIKEIPSMLDFIYDMVHSSYLNPLCILRLPASYGSRFFWTGYMRHYFAFRHPYLLDGTFTAGKVEAQVYKFGDPSNLAVMPNGKTQIVPVSERPENFIGVFHAEPTDPYAYDNEIQKITMDEDSGLIAQFRDKLNNASVSDVLDYIRGKEKAKSENVADQPPTIPEPKT